MASKKTETPETPETVTLTVSATRDGFRRCGMSFGKEPVDVTVTPEQAETLKAEPLLIVTEAAE